MLTNNIKKFILDISKTPIVVVASKNTKNSCHDIVKWQLKEIGKIKGRPAVINTEYQVPEPFSGKIDEANYLVLSSNPAFDIKESDLGWCAKRKIPLFPVINDKADVIIDFFYSRLDHYSNPSYLTYVTYICKWIDEIESGTIKTTVDDSLPEKNIKTTAVERECYKNHIVLADIVPFKSNKEYGVKKVIDGSNFDVLDYLKQVLSFFKGDYIILCGKKVLDCVKSNLSIEAVLRSTGKKIYYTPHPRSRGTMIDRINKTYRMY